MTGSFIKIFLYFAPLFFDPDALIKERCRSGLTGTPGKRVYLKRVPGVQIPLSPQTRLLPRHAGGFLLKSELFLTVVSSKLYCILIFVYTQVNHICLVTIEADQNLIPDFEIPWLFI